MTTNTNAALTDEQIDAAFDRMPEGAQGFLKSWGNRQFAREIAALAATPAAPMSAQGVPSGWSDGAKAVAKMLKKKADDFALEHGHDDMGGLSFGSGAHAEAKMDWHSSLLELAEEVHSMTSQAFPMIGDEDESDLGDWQDGSTKPTQDGTYLREFDEGPGTSEFHQGKWLRDEFFPSDIQDARWRGRTAPVATPAETESVLIDGIAYDVPAAVAGELLRLHLEILAATPAAPAAQGDALDASAASAAGAPIIWPAARDVGRIGDMSPSAHIRVGLDSDNDVYVSVWGEDGGGSVEFCNGGGGGGQSSHTRMALIALMVAMEADNAKTPSRDWWAVRSGDAARAANGE
jgi:hypothetical protein